MKRGRPKTDILGRLDSERRRAVAACPHVDSAVDTAGKGVEDALYFVAAVRELDPREVWGEMALWVAEDPRRLFGAVTVLAAMVPQDKTVNELLAWTEGLAAGTEGRAA